VSFRVTDKANGAQPEVREHIEYAQAMRQHANFDRAAWSASVAYRRQMPRLSADVFDPGPKGLRGGRSPAAFIADDESVSASTRVTKIDGAVGLVRAVSVAADTSFVPGTLVVRVRPKDVEEVYPQTLHLLRLDEEAKGYEIVDAAGFDVERGYVWGRITRPGTYGVFGLPDLGALAGFDFRHPVGLDAIRLILVHLFSPGGAWTSLGPSNLSCCIRDFAIATQHSDRLYAAASDGGIWRLDSLAAYPGTTWVPLTDGQPSLVINCIAVSAADNSVVYYVDEPGHLFRSSDRGDTWLPAGDASLFYARRLLVHPTDPNTIYVATSTGLWRSQAGGATWDSNPGQTTLHDGDVLDVVMDPDDSAILFVAQRGVGVLRSGDSGATWTLTLPWSAASGPSNTMIQLAVGGQGTAATRTVVAKLDQEVFVNRAGGKSLSMPGGGAWTSHGQIGGNGYGDWCHVVAVDPFDDNTILAGAQQLYRTPNGGARWDLVIDYYRPHEDQHRLAFDPCERGVVYAANDGGVFRSLDSGATWQTGGDDVALGLDLTRGLVTAQFYAAGVAGEHAVGDAYHQGLLGARALAQGDWEGIEGHSWESARVHGDPVRAGRYYVFSNVLWRRTYPSPPTGALITIGSFQPTAIAVDQHPGSSVLLAATAAGQVMRAADGDTDAPSWTPMLGISLSPGDVIVSFDFARVGPAHKAYALAASGRVFACDDTDTSSAWTEVGGLPQRGVALAASFEDANRVFAIGNASVFRTTDGGATAWTAVPGSGASALPPGLDLRSIVTGPGALYLAAASGVFKSPDAGQTWFPFHEGLPNVQIMELLWTEGDLVAVTHGRGLWHHATDSLVPEWPEAAALPDLAREHAPDVGWLIELWRAIHGGDPAPSAIRSRIDTRVEPANAARDPRRGTPSRVAPGSRAQRRS
jgi:hypothetical protein